MSTQYFSRQIRAFLRRAEENPTNAGKLLPGGVNLLRLTDDVKPDRELKGLREDLRKWITEHSPNPQLKKTAS